MEAIDEITISSAERQEIERSRGESLVPRRKAPECFCQSNSCVATPLGFAHCYSNPNLVTDIEDIYIKGWQRVELDLSGGQGLPTRLYPDSRCHCRGGFVETAFGRRYCFSCLYEPWDTSGLIREAESIMRIPQRSTDRPLPTHDWPDGFTNLDG